MSEAPIITFSKEVSVEALQMEVKGGETDLLIYLNDPDWNGGEGTGTGKISNSFIKLDGTFRYNDWTSLDDPPHKLQFEAKKEDKTIVIDFIGGNTTGSGLGQRIIVGQYRLEKQDDPKELNLSGTCHFAPGLIGQSTREVLKKA